MPVQKQTRLSDSAADEETAKKPENASPTAGRENADSMEKLELRLFRMLLEKYADIINEREKRTIGEIKAMVSGDDLTIQSALEQIRPEGFEFEKNYAEAAKKAFAFVCGEIRFVRPKLSLNYWLTPAEIMSERLGDDEDLAVFLCSLLAGLGDEKAEVVIAELDNLETHAFAITEISGKFFLFDPSQKHEFEKFSGEKEKVLAEYSCNGAKIKGFLYKFNSKNYEQFI